MIFFKIIDNIIVCLKFTDCVFSRYVFRNAISIHPDSLDLRTDSPTLKMQSLVRAISPVGIVSSGTFAIANVIIFFVFFTYSEKDFIISGKRLQSHRIFVYIKTRKVHEKSTKNTLTH